MSTTLTAETGDTRSAWGAVMSMALCVAVLIASEFMPVSLLTPIAGELGVSEGQAGQAISISGLFALITIVAYAQPGGPALPNQIEKRRDLARSES